MLYKGNYKIGYGHCLERKIPVVKIYLLVCVEKIGLRPNFLYLIVDFRLHRIGQSLCEKYDSKFFHSDLIVSKYLGRPCTMYDFHDFGLT